MSVLDAQSSTFEAVVQRPVVGGTLSLDLADQSVTWLRFRCVNP